MIAGRRFGAGSARPHAAVALAEAGVRVVIAASFGEGFFRAAVNRACLYPIRVSLEASEEMLRTIALDDRLRIDLDRGCITRLAPGCGAGDFADGWAFEPLGVIRAIIERGGLLAHIEQAGYPTTRLANNPRGQGSNQIG